MVPLINCSYQMFIEGVGFYCDGDGRTVANGLRRQVQEPTQLLYQLLHPGLLWVLQLRTDVEIDRGHQLQYRIERPYKDSGRESTEDVLYKPHTLYIVIPYTHIIHYVI